MKEYEVTFQITGEFTERVNAGCAEDAVKVARQYVEDEMPRPRYPHTVDVVKVAVI